MHETAKGQFSRELEKIKIWGKTLFNVQRSAHDSGRTKCQNLNYLIKTLLFWTNFFRTFLLAPHLKLWRIKVFVLALLLANSRKAKIVSDESEINRGDEQSQKLTEITSLWIPTFRQFSQNVDVNGPHHGPYQLMASSSLHCHRLVEWGRHNELEASMVRAVYVHVLRTLLSGRLEVYRVRD